MNSELTTGRTILGSWVPTGQDRRDLVARVAYARALFEFEYDGLRLAPCDRDFVFREAKRISGRDVYVTDALVKAVQRRTLGWLRDLAEFEPERRGSKAPREWVEERKAKEASR